jgi:tetratricopeptide (TPR) repeat protein
LAYRGRLEDGLAYVEKAAENRRKNRPGTRYLAQMLQLQASILVDLGRYPEAKRLMDESAEIAQKTKFPTQYLAVDERARLLIATGHASDADPVLQPFHSATPLPGALDIDSLLIENLRSEIALARGDPETAGRLAGHVVQVLSASSARDYMKSLDARASLVQGRSYLQLGRPTEALPLLQRSVELRQSAVEPVSPLLASAQIALAECYLSVGNRDQAQAMALTAKNSLGTHQQLSNLYTHPLEELQKNLQAAR